MEKNAVFYYYPQPVIPYAQSAFESTMEFDLADKSSGLFLLEIISCGRKASDERFQYRKFASRVNIRRGGQLIYRDNTRYEPDKWTWKGLECMKDIPTWPIFSKRPGHGHAGKDMGSSGK